MKNDASQPQNIVILFLIIKNKQFPFESVCTFMGTVIGSFTDAEEPFTDAEGTLFAMPPLCENKNK